jgi:DHA2 family multidrug resistance protein
MSERPGLSSVRLEGFALVGAALLLGLANFMVVLDTTIANVSVPHIAGGLAVSPSQGTWVITSYSVAEAITVPLTGWLVQRFGPIKVFCTAMAGFGACSFLCGLAPSFGLLVAFRVMQGLCGGPMMPTSQTLMLTIFPRERSAQAMGLWSMTTVAGPIAGPVLGGLISDNIGWSWIFFLNIPVAIGVVFGVWTMLGFYREATRRLPVDYVGALLLVVWVGCLQIMLDKGKELEWFASATIVTLAVIAVIAFLAFLIWELTAENPIVDLRIFRHRGFVVGVLINSLTFGTYFSTVVLIPLWLQTSMDYTATSAGYASAASGAIALFVSPVVARLVGRFDPRGLVCFGLCWFAAVAFWRSQLTTDITFSYISLTYLAQGFAVPFFFVPTVRMTLSSVLPQETASAAGLSNFLRTCGAAFGTSITTTLWDSTATSKRNELVGALHDQAGSLGALTSHGLSMDQALGQIDRIVQTQATMLSTNQLFAVTAVLFMIGAMVIWLAPKPQTGGGPQPARSR